MPVRNIALEKFRRAIGDRHRDSGGTASLETFPKPFCYNQIRRI